MTLLRNNGIFKSKTDKYSTNFCIILRWIYSFAQRKQIKTRTTCYCPFLSVTYLSGTRQLRTTPHRNRRPFPDIFVEYISRFRIDWSFHWNINSYWPVKVLRLSNFSMLRKMFPPKLIRLKLLKWASSLKKDSNT